MPKTKKQDLKSQISDKQEDAIRNTQYAIRYSFPTVSACPRCRGTNTRATSTQGKIQYRICMSAVCRQRYSVIGTKVEVTKGPKVTKVS